MGPRVAPDTASTNHMLGGYYFHFPCHTLSCVNAAFGFEHLKTSACKLPLQMLLRKKRKDPASVPWAYGRGNLEESISLQNRNTQAHSQCPNPVHTRLAKRNHYRRPRGYLFPRGSSGDQSTTSNELQDFGAYNAAPNFISIGC